MSPPREPRPGKTEIEGAIRRADGSIAPAAARTAAAACARPKWCRRDPGSTARAVAMPRSRRRPDGSKPRARVTAKPGWPVAALDPAALAALPVAWNGRCGELHQRWSRPPGERVHPAGLLGRRRRARRRTRPCRPAAALPDGRWFASAWPRLEEGVVHRPGSAARGRRSGLAMLGRAGAHAATRPHPPWPPGRGRPAGKSRRCRAGTAAWHVLADRAGLGLARARPAGREARPRPG